MATDTADQKSLVFGGDFGECSVLIGVQSCQLAIGKGEGGGRKV